MKVWFGQSLFPFLFQSFKCYSKWTYLWGEKISLEVFGDTTCQEGHHIKKKKHHKHTSVNGLSDKLFLVVGTDCITHFTYFFIMFDEQTEVFSIFINWNVACKTLCTNICKIGIGGDTNPSHRAPYASVVSQHLQQKQWLPCPCAEWIHLLRLLPSQIKRAKWCCEWLLMSKDLSGSLIFFGDLIQQSNLVIPHCTFYR